LHIVFLANGVSKTINRNADHAEGKTELTSACFSTYGLAKAQALVGVNPFLEPLVHDYRLTTGDGLLRALIVLARLSNALTIFVLAVELAREAAVVRADLVADVSVRSDIVFPGYEYVFNLRNFIFADAERELVGASQAPDL
jgi:hypothetical protein